MFALKFLGVFLIVISCMVAGFLKSFSIKSRCKKLSLFKDGLNTFYEHIEQGEKPLAEAMKSAFYKCNFLCVENDIICSDNDLSKEDQAMIVDFLKSLGCGCKKSECERIRMFEASIKRRLKEAENDVLQKGRLYKTLGVCVGVTIGILLI